MKKKPGQLLQLARNALEKAGANPVMAEGIEIANDLRAKIENLANG